MPWPCKRVKTFRLLFPLTEKDISALYMEELPVCVVSWVFWKEVMTTTQTDIETSELYIVIHWSYDTVPFNHSIPKKFLDVHVVLFNPRHTNPVMVSWLVFLVKITGKRKCQLQKHPDFITLQSCQWGTVLIVNWWRWSSSLWVFYTMGKWL